MGNIDEALKECELTIILNPKDHQNYLKTAQIKILLGDFNQAITDLSSALDHLKDKDQEGLFEMYFSRGECYRKVKNLEKAISDLEKAYE